MYFIIVTLVSVSILGSGSGWVQLAPKIEISDVVAHYSTREICEAHIPDVKRVYFDAYAKALGDHAYAMSAQCEFENIQLNEEKN